MTLRDEISNDYFEWMSNLVCEDRYAKSISYRKLLMHLHSTEFTYRIRRDENRADDGVALRYRFADEYAGIENAERYLEGPCSILEMMVALSIRCEENIMDDPRVGDRTGQWFWGMLTNLGLGSMTDDRFDRRYTQDILDRFLNRKYERDGKGGLFRIRNCERDMRTAEIWYQLCWYLDSIV